MPAKTATKKKTTRKKKEPKVSKFVTKQVKFFIDTDEQYDWISEKSFDPTEEATISTVADKDELKFEISCQTRKMSIDVVKDLVKSIENIDEIPAPKADWLDDSKISVEIYPRITFPAFSSDYASRWTQEKNNTVRSKGPVLHFVSGSTDYYFSCFKEDFVKAINLILSD